MKLTFSEKEWHVITKACPSLKKEYKLPVCIEEVKDDESVSFVMKDADVISLVNTAKEFGIVVSTAVTPVAFFAKRVVKPVINRIFRGK